MPLSIVVQSIAHNVIRTIADDANGTFMALCRGSIGRSCTIGFVAPYADTMFNAFQLKRFLTELDSAAGAAALSDDQRGHLRDIGAAAEEAIRANGYLLIVGD